MKMTHALYGDMNNSRLTKLVGLKNNMKNDGLCIIALIIAFLIAVFIFFSNIICDFSIQSERVFEKYVKEGIELDI